MGSGCRGMGGVVSQLQLAFAFSHRRRSSALENVGRGGGWEGMRMAMGRRMHA